MNISKFLIFLFGVAATISSAHGTELMPDGRVYQYIEIFAGDFPLPVRFELIAWSDDSLEYSSPAPLHKKRSSLLTDMPKVGFITVGNREDADKEASGSVVTKIATCGDLEISRVTPKEVPKGLKNGFPQLILITDDKHYLTIADIDENIWRELVLVFAKNMEIPSSACQV